MLGRVKRLEHHPVKELWGTDKFLRILQAQQEGLITYRLEVSRPVPGQEHLLK